MKRKKRLRETIAEAWDSVSTTTYQLVDGEIATAVPLVLPQR